jgi:hypothetical protein
MTPPVAPPVPHTTLFSQLYNWLGKLTFLHWPTLVAELAGGLFLVALVTVVVLLAHGWVALLLLATAGSLAFELKLDPSGFKWLDVLERELGILVGVLIVHLVLRL